MTKPARLLITRRILPAGLALLEQSGLELDYHDSELPLSRDELSVRLRPCHGALTMVNDPIDADLLQQCPNLRAIANHAVGLDNIDLEAARARGIAIGNTPGVLTQATAELTIGLIITLARQLYQRAQTVQQGQWQVWSPTSYLGTELQGLKLGIIGMGRIGERVAHIARAAFDMEIFYYNRSGERATPFPARYLELDKLLQQSDIISLHCDYNASTHHLINRQRLPLLQPHGLLVNTTRGGVIDQEALLWALDHKLLAGAALDVTTPEPLPKGHPLTGRPDVFITPHIGSATHTTRNRMSALAARFLIEFFAKNP